MNNEVIMAQNVAYKAWEKHVSNQFMLYPNEYLTRFIYKHKFNSVLDYGCGDGRHTQMIALSGAKSVIAIDINKKCVDMTSKRCQDFSAVKTLWLDTPTHSLKSLISDSVDCIVCFGVFSLNNHEIVKSLFKEFGSILESGGRLFGNWRTRNDTLYQNGKEIGENLFIISRKSHEDLLYYFPSLDEIRRLYASAGFEILSVDTEEFTTDNRQIKNSFYLIDAIKR